MNSEESDAERCPSLKNILVEPEGIYQHTQICTGMITQVDYNLLARGIEVNNKHSAIIESQSSNSYVWMKAFAYMASTPEEVAGPSTTSTTRDAPSPVTIYKRLEEDDNSFSQEEDKESKAQSFF